MTDRYFTSKFNQVMKLLGPIKTVSKEDVDEFSSNLFDEEIIAPGDNLLVMARAYQKMLKEDAEEDAEHSARYKRLIKSSQFPFSNCYFSPTALSLIARSRLNRPEQDAPSDPSPIISTLDLVASRAVAMDALEIAFFNSNRAISEILLDKASKDLDYRALEFRTTILTEIAVVSSVCLLQLTKLSGGGSSPFPRFSKLGLFLRCFPLLFMYCIMKAVNLLMDFELLDSKKYGEGTYFPKVTTTKYGYSIDEFGDLGPHLMSTPVLGADIWPGVNSLLEMSAFHIHYADYNKPYNVITTLARDVPYMLFTLRLTKIFSTYQYLWFPLSAILGSITYSLTHDDGSDRGMSGLSNEKRMGSHVSDFLLLFTAYTLGGTPAFVVCYFANFYVFKSVYAYFKYVETIFRSDDYKLYYSATILDQLICLVFSTALAIYPLSFFLELTPHSTNESVHDFLEHIYK